MNRQLVVVKQGEGETLSALGTQLKFLCTGDKTDHAWSMMEIVLPRHAGPPMHDHAWDEAYYVVRGEVRFQLADGEHVIRAGEFLYAPGGTLHGFQGSSDEPAHMLILDVPSHAEAFFRELDREVKGLAAPAGNIAPPHISGGAHRHQIFIIPYFCGHMPSLTCTLLWTFRPLVEGDLYDRSHSCAGTQ